MTELFKLQKWENFKIDFSPFLFGGKTESRREMIESNSNVSVFPSNPDHENVYLLSFDPMPPLWASYAICARVVDSGVDMIISVCADSCPHRPAFDI